MLELCDGFPALQCRCRELLAHCLRCTGKSSSGLDDPHRELLQLLMRPLHLSDQDFPTRKMLVNEIH